MNQPNWVNQPFSIILFLKEKQENHDTSVVFPFLPEQIYDENFDIHCVNCDVGTCYSPDVVNSKDQTTHIPFYDIHKKGGVPSIVSSLIHADGMEQRRIFTVHPNNVLLPIYRWYLLSKGCNAVAADQYVQQLSRRTIDLCEAFHRPTILTLDRRQNFNYKTVARWLEVQQASVYPVENCLNTLKYLCLKL